MVVEIDNGPFTYIKESSVSGCGLFASKNFKKGEVVIDDNPYASNFYKIKWNDLTPNQYNKNWLVPLNEIFCFTNDKSCKFHYLNHSRTPNCDWHIKQLIIVANKNIQQDEELFIDYRLEYRPNRSKYPEWI